MKDKFTDTHQRTHTHTHRHSYAYHRAYIRLKLYFVRKFCHLFMLYTIQSWNLTLVLLLFSLMSHCWAIPSLSSNPPDPEQLETNCWGTCPTQVKHKYTSQQLAFSVVQLLIVSFLLLFLLHNIITWQLRFGLKRTRSSCKNLYRLARFLSFVKIWVNIKDIRCV